MTISKSGLLGRIMSHDSHNLVNIRTYTKLIVQWNQCLGGKGGYQLLLYTHQKCFHVC